MARMPYTNFHELNQDWIIKQVKTAYNADNPPPYPVKSVNGQTGNVNLNSDNIIDVDSGIDLTDALRAKQNRPSQTGTAGQVLGLDNQLNPVWVNQNQGVTAYDDLTGKPKINGHTLSGEMNGADIGLIDEPATPGTVGQVLTSDGNGSQTWENLPDYSDVYAPIIRDTASGDPLSFPDGMANKPMNVLVNIVPVQDFNGYGYPWPDGGGPNVWNEETIFGYFNDSGVWTIRNDILSSKNAIKVTPSESYYIVCPNATFVTYWKSEVTPDNAPASEFISRSQVTNQTHQLNIPANCNYIFFNLPTAYGTTYNHDVSVNYPASITFYRPYSNICPISGNAGLTLYTSGSDTSNPDVYLVAWGDVAGTVYGGTFNAKTGKLTVTHKIVNMSSLTWGVVSGLPAGEHAYSANIADKNNRTQNSPIDIYCSMFKVSAQNIWIVASMDDCSIMSKTNNVYVRYNAMTTKNDFETAISGQTIVYKLTTPIEYTLYSYDINSLYGENNVWTDVGPVSVDYYADTKLFILKMVSP